MQRPRVRHGRPAGRAEPAGTPPAKGKISRAAPCRRPAQAGSARSAEQGCPSHGPPPSRCTSRYVSAIVSSPPPGPRAFASIAPYTNCFFLVCSVSRLSCQQTVGYQRGALPNTISARRGQVPISTARVPLPAEQGRWAAADGTPMPASTAGALCRRVQPASDGRRRHRPPPAQAIAPPAGPRPTAARPLALLSDVPLLAPGRGGLTGLARLQPDIAFAVRRCDDGGPRSTAPVGLLGAGSFGKVWRLSQPSSPSRRDPREHYPAISGQLEPQNAGPLSLCRSVARRGAALRRQQRGGPPFSLLCATAPVAWPRVSSGLVIWRRISFLCPLRTRRGGSRLPPPRLPGPGYERRPRPRLRDRDGFLRPTAIVTADSTKIR